MLYCENIGLSHSELKSLKKRELSIDSMINGFQFFFVIAKFQTNDVKADNFEFEC